MRICTVALILALATACRPQTTTPIDLIDRLHEGRMQPGDLAFDIAPIRAPHEFTAASPSRLTLRLGIGRRQELKVGVEMPADAATDGDPDALLSALIGVADGATYRTVATIRPREALGRIVPVTVDLRQYEGLVVDLIFNVRGGRPGSDMVRWHDPMVTLR